MRKRRRCSPCAYMDVLSKRGQRVHMWAPVVCVCVCATHIPASLYACCVCVGACAIISSYKADRGGASLLVDTVILYAVYTHTHMHTHRSMSSNEQRKAEYKTRKHTHTQARTKSAMYPLSVSYVCVLVHATCVVCMCVCVDRHVSTHLRFSPGAPAMQTSVYV